MTSSRRSSSASVAQSDPEAAATQLDEVYAYLGSAARRGPAFRRFVLETGADDPLLGSHLTRVAGDGDGEVPVLRPRSARRRASARCAACARAARGLRRLEGSRQGLLPGGHDAPGDISARRPGRPGGDGERGGGPLPVPRPSRLRACSRPAGRREARRPGGQAPAAPAGRAGPARGDRIPAEAALPRPRGRAVLRPGGAPAWVEDALSPAVPGRDRHLGRRAGSTASSRRCRAGRAEGVREGMALVGVLSTQLWHRAFIGSGAERLSSGDDRAAGQDRPHQNISTGEAR